SSCIRPIWADASTPSRCIFISHSPGRSGAGSAATTSGHARTAAARTLEHFACIVISSEWTTGRAPRISTASGRANAAFLGFSADDGRVGQLVRIGLARGQREVLGKQRVDGGDRRDQARLEAPGLEITGHAG